MEMEKDKELFYSFPFFFNLIHMEIHTECKPPQENIFISFNFVFSFHGNATRTQQKYIL